MTAVQSSPDSNANYRAFPKKTIRANTGMYRAHSIGRSPWWFSSERTGRFNLSAPRGTCYAASRVDTAVREKVRDEISSTGVVSRAFAEGFVVSAITAPADCKLAAVSSAGAARFDVRRALVTMDNYDIPQEWAEVFADAGFHGIYYGSAYTTGAASAVALFGAAGDPGPQLTSTVHMTGPDACADAGMTVEAPPTLGALTII